jgi:hypothetical protein
LFALAIPKIVMPGHPRRHDHEANIHMSDSQDATPHSRDAKCVRVFPEITLEKKKEGAGNTECAARTHSLACGMKEHTSFSHHRYAVAPAFPARCFTTYFVISPVRPGFFVTVASRKIEKLDTCIGAPGPHDFAVRVDAARPATPSVPSHPAARS